MHLDSAWKVFTNIIWLFFKTLQVCHIHCLFTVVHDWWNALRREQGYLSWGSFAKLSRWESVECSVHWIPFPLISMMRTSLVHPCLLLSLQSYHSFNVMVVSRKKEFALQTTFIGIWVSWWIKKTESKTIWCAMKKPDVLIWLNRMLQDWDSLTCFGPLHS